MRPSRHCYDKPWRCPGWAGGGWTTPAVSRCAGGSLDIYRPQQYVTWRRHWRISRCNTCDVRALPFATRWIDPTWLTWWARRIPGRIRDRIDLAHHRRDRGLPGTLRRWTRQLTCTHTDRSATLCAYCRKVWPR